MDIILTTYFKRFNEAHGLTAGTDEERFEKFINYVVCSEAKLDNSNFSAVGTGSGGDLAIDGLAIAVNGRLINETAEMQEIVSKPMDNKIAFHFIQTKTSSQFEGKEMLAFGSGVLELFKDTGDIRKVQNDKIKDKQKTVNLFLENYDMFSSERSCILYYVTTGKWVDDQNLLCDIAKIKQDVASLDIFDRIEFFPIDADRIRRLYEKTKVQNSAEFRLSNKIEVPYYVDGVKEAYVAIMSAKEFLGIIEDSDKSLKRGIFELNVRDFNGVEDNRVNNDIVNTIISKDKNQFGFLNNGITIVGKRLSKIKDMYTIKDFYIVNGCQTSNVLHLKRDEIDDNMWVGVKIIITDEEEIIANIVKATNNQTQIAEIQLNSMKEYHYLLESYFNTYTKYFKLYYERREGQYNSDGSIDKGCIINYENQIKSFAAIFLGEPHKSSRYYGDLTKDIGTRIFLEGHKPIIYWTSAFLNYKLESLMNNDGLERVFHKFKYHIMYTASRIVWKDEQIPYLNSSKIESFCEKLIAEVNDDSKFNALVENSIDVIKNTGIDVNNLEINKTTVLAQQIDMFVNMRINAKQLALMENFTKNISFYRNPIHNINVDGDLRYNFNARLNDLTYFLTVCGMKELSKKIDVIAAGVIENDRNSRKKTAKLILTEVDQYKNAYQKMIEQSQKYDIKE